MNLVVLLGRTTKDIELRVTQSGTSVARFTLAVNRPYTAKGKEKEADFFSCIAFGTTAENISRYISKGRQILIEGHLQNNSYEKKDGTKSHSTDIIVNRFYFADSKQSGQANEQANYQAQGQQSQTATNDVDNSFFSLADNDDDLPF